MGVGVIKPDLPDLDLEAWAAQPEPQRVRAMCESWAMQGFGAPLVAYAFYVFKVLAYVAVWILLVSRAPGIAGLSDIADWWALPIAFQKAIVWTLLFEVLGLGCGSGPLTGRYVPPIVALTHFLRPGTIRLPPFPRQVPLTAGDRRGAVDVALYVALIALCLRALLSTEVLLDAGDLLPVVIVLAVLGLRDKTVFLAARAEHYWVTLVVFVLAGDDVTVMLAGSMVVQLAIWWGAATSKLNHHFPNVVTIMVSNSPFLRVPALRRAMYRDFPDDLRPSGLAAALAHGGTVIEYLFPLVLAVSAGGTPTTVALAVMLSFHLFITSCFPMGVPIEWNVLFLYSMFVLFGHYAELSPLDVFDEPLLAALLIAGLLVGPVYGSLRPDRISFLPAMRYYAGNWAASLWLFRKGRDAVLDERITKTAKTLVPQLETLYGEETIRAVQGKLRAFRSMHLHGRALNAVLPHAVDDLEAYDIQEGEGTCGIVLGWNFGDGHLHHEQLLAAVQARCGFAPGDLRCVFLESQPINRPWMHWRVVDAADGLLDQGHIVVADLLAHQPWPEGDIPLHVEVAGHR
jgi:Transmembrane protein of unknown function (DUF3556)